MVEDAQNGKAHLDGAQVTCGKGGGYGDNPGRPQQRGGDVVRGEARGGG